MGMFSFSKKVNKPSIASATKQVPTVKEGEFITVKVKMSADVYRRLRVLSLIEGTTVGKVFDMAASLYLDMKKDVIKENF